MTIAFVDGTITAAGPPFVPAEYAGAGEGDLILAWGHINSNDGVWTYPADFTEIDQFGETTGTPDTRMFYAYKIRGSDAGNGYSFGYDGTDLAAQVGIVGFSGDNLQFDVTYVKANHYIAANNTLNQAGQAITTIEDNAVVALLYSASGGAIDSIGPPSGYTQEKAATATVNMYMCWKAIASAATETPGDFTHTDAGGLQDPRVTTIAISESAAVGDNTIVIVPTGPAV